MPALQAQVQVHFRSIQIQSIQSYLKTKHLDLELTLNYVCHHSPPQNFTLTIDYWD